MFSPRNRLIQLILFSFTQRFSTFLTVTLSLFVGLVILGKILMQFRSFRITEHLLCKNETFQHSVEQIPLSAGQ